MFPPPPPPPLIDDSSDQMDDDGNEPYSPGRAFDDEVMDTSVGKSVDNLTLDEVNRQIKEREKELQQIAVRIGSLFLSNIFMLYKKFKICFFFFVTCSVGTQ